MKRHWKNFNQVIRSDPARPKSYEIFNRYWYPDVTPKYGNCYTFNSMANIANDPDVPRYASLTGRDYGKF